MTGSEWMDERMGDLPDGLEEGGTVIIFGQTYRALYNVELMIRTSIEQEPECVDFIVVKDDNYRYEDLLVFGGDLISFLEKTSDIGEDKKLNILIDIY